MVGEFRFNSSLLDHGNVIFCMGWLGLGEEKLHRIWPEVAWSNKLRCGFGGVASSALNPRITFRQAGRVLHLKRKCFKIK